MIHYQYSLIHKYNEGQEELDINVFSIVIVRNRDIVKATKLFLTQFLS